MEQRMFRCKRSFKEKLYARNWLLRLSSLPVGLSGTT
jgi:hypothetical protein